MANNELNERQRRFADNVLRGMTQEEAYIAAGYKSKGAAARKNASRLMTNEDVQAYLNDRRAELAEVALVEAKDVVREQMQRAFFTFESLVSEQLHGPEDIAKLPKQTQRLIKGWRYDQHGNLILDFVDRDTALDRLSRIFGVYQGEYTNSRDREANLLDEPFWDWVMSQHLHTGEPVADLISYGENNPKVVEKWAARHRPLPEGDEDAA